LPLANPASEAMTSTATKMIEAHRPRVRLTPVRLH
jgi:hypothetical protein